MVLDVPVISRGRPIVTCRGGRVPTSVAGSNHARNKYGKEKYSVLRRGAACGMQEQQLKEFLLQGGDGRKEKCRVEF